MDNKTLDHFIENALNEDIGDGDHSSIACIPENATGKVELLIKEKGVLAGSEVAITILKKIDSTININQFIKDGSKVNSGDIAFTAEGKVRTLLKTERLILNIMQRMSGIATNTSLYAEKLKGVKAKVLDTRKTTPGIRFLEKLAVKTGGGENHRMGLYDMVMLKDNHIDFAGGIEEAIKAVKNYLNKKNKKIKIEIEVRDLDELKKVIEIGGVDRIMLDNFDIPTTKEAVDLIANRYETESSGNITLDNLREYAETGIDYISVGALTHQIKSMDMSLKAI
ncbi:carboxylating nicotinate-nucleotide diphosphorylase [Marinilabiliaceae bacterium ANBcel2]|nr:carboxylating nicotinate-nucleotide diphosphorylase [Marinilabiliaceae bacterium ANBcel2]